MKIVTIDKLSDLGTVAEEIIAQLNGRKVILFRAEMGAGKTTLIREIVAQKGSADCVTSPTFAIINEYLAGDEQIFHFDMYRIESIQEALDAGCEDCLYSGALCLVEWPENIERILPEDAMTVEIIVESQEGRTFKIN